MIDALSSEDADYTDPMSAPAPWHRVGRYSFYTFSAVALGAFVPAAFQKKRNYAILIAASGESSSPIQAQELSPEGEALPVPPCSSEDAARIREIFTTVATSGYWGLLRNAFHLTKLGNQLREHRVHPFAFLKEAPKNHLRSIFRGGISLKIDGVMGGVEEGMQRERTTLSRYIGSFAADMGKDAQQIKRLIQESAWRPLVRYLFDITP